MHSKNIHLFQLHDEMPDFFILIGSNDIFQVQREKVAGFSSRLRNIVYDDKGDGSRSAQVNEVSPKVFTLILRYIYDEVIEIPSEDIAEVYKAARYFELDDLARHCQVNESSGSKLKVKRQTTLSKTNYLPRLCDLEELAIKKANSSITPQPLNKLEDLPDIGIVLMSDTSCSKDVKLNLVKNRPKPEDPLVSDLRQELKKKSELIRMKNDMKTNKVERPQVRRVVENSKDKERTKSNQKTAEEYIRTHDIPVEVLEYYRDKYLRDNVEEPKTKPSPEEKLLTKINKKQPPPLLSPKPKFENFKFQPQSQISERSSKGEFVELRQKRQVGKWVANRTETLKSRNSLVDETEVKKTPSLRRSVSNVETKLENVVKINPRQRREDIKEEQAAEVAVGDLINISNDEIPKLSEENQKKFEQVEVEQKTEVREGPRLATIRETLVVGVGTTDHTYKDRLKVVQNCSLTGVVVSLPVKTPSTLLNVGVFVEVTKNKSVVSKGEFNGHALSGNEVVIRLDKLDVQKYDFLYFNFTLSKETTLAVFNKVSQVKDELVPLKSEGVITKISLQ